VFGISSLFVCSSVRALKEGRRFAVLRFLEDTLRTAIGNNVKWTEYISRGFLIYTLHQKVSRVLIKKDENWQDMQHTKINKYI
jgi:hypothetical protein